MDGYVKIPNEWQSLNGMDFFDANDSLIGKLELTAGKVYTVEISQGFALGTPGMFIYQGDKPTDNDKDGIGTFLIAGEGQAKLGIGSEDTWIKIFDINAPSTLNILGV